VLLKSPSSRIFFCDFLNVHEPDAGQCDSLYIYAGLKCVVKSIADIMISAAVIRPTRHGRMTFHTNTKTSASVMIKGKDFLQKSVRCIVFYLNFDGDQRLARRGPLTIDRSDFATDIPCCGQLGNAAKCFKTADFLSRLSGTASCEALISYAGHTIWSEQTTRLK
jgi:hypothetical protein